MNIHHYIFISFILISSCSSLAPLFKAPKLNFMGVKAPVTPKHSREIITFGETLTDDYYWLREKESKEVRSHLETEAQYTENVLSKNKKNEEVIFNEIKQRLDLPLTSLYKANGEYSYYSHYDKGSEYPKYYREDKNKKTELVFDAEAEAKKHKYFQIGAVKPSPDNKILAYCEDIAGRRNYQISFKKLSSSELLPVTINNVTNNFVWASDNEHFFYVKQDVVTLRWYQVWRLNVKTYQAELVYEEKNKEFSVYLEKSNTGTTIFITSESSHTSEQRYIDAIKPKDEPKLIQPRITGVRYFAKDGGDRFYIRTDYHSPNFKVMKVLKNSTGLGFHSWQEILAHDEKIYIEDFQVYEDFIVAQLKEGGLNRFKVISRSKSLTSHFLKFDEKAYLASLNSELPYTSAYFSYSYEGPVTPREDMKYQVFKKEPTVEREFIIPHFSSNDYSVEVMNISSRDDNEIPVTLIMRKDTKPLESTPFILYGYGAYGYTIEPSFNGSIISLLDRGYIFAMAHVRGSSKKGVQWYLNGKLENKKNSFYDFIDVAKYFIKNKYTSSEHLTAMGASAGGLLVAASMNEEPELFSAVVAEVPFVDVLNTMLDNTIPLTEPEYQEWGNPSEADYYQYIKSYSPYDNIQKRNYPHVLATAYFMDSQVQYWEPAKWISKLREYNQNKQSQFLLDIHFTGGHGGESGRLGRSKQKARIYAFLLGLEGK